jgi:hypothetical protein
MKLYNFFASVLACTASSVRAGPNLIPDQPNRSPDYFCTWNVQGYACSYASTLEQRNAMVEANLFGTETRPGWIDLYPEVRAELFFVLDDAWDVPLKRGEPQYGSLILNAERFPSLPGTPSERLNGLTTKVRARGWRGLGGWVCAQQAPALARDDEWAYWRERFEWMRDAGVSYWKVDWGAKERDVDWRNKMTQIAREIAPDLIIEHALVEGSLKEAAVFRTYDVENVIAAPVTIGRIADLLRGAPKDSPTIINCEDEPYIAAGTGCAIGVMRHGFAGPLPDGRADFCFPAVGRDLKHRLDEVVRAVRWHKLAEPVPAGAPGTTIDDQALHDYWTLAPGETWTNHQPGDRREGAAPARIARGGLDLPEVRVPDGVAPPFVMVTRSQNGPVAIATIGRTIDREYLTPKARITQFVGDADTIGIFGIYESLTLRFSQPIGNARIFAQDLAAAESQDITERVNIDGNAISIDGETIAEIGLGKACPGDRSEPGVVLKLSR